MHESELILKIIKCQGKLAIKNKEDYYNCSGKRWG